MEIFKIRKNFLHIFCISFRFFSSHSLRVASLLLLYVPTRVMTSKIFLWVNEAFQDIFPLLNWWWWWKFFVFICWNESGCVHVRVWIFIFIQIFLITFYICWNSMHSFGIIVERGWMTECKLWFLLFFFYSERSNEIFLQISTHQGMTESHVYTDIIDVLNSKVFIFLLFTFSKVIMKNEFMLKMRISVTLLQFCVQWDENEIFLCIKTSRVESSARSYRTFVSCWYSKKLLLHSILNSHIQCAKLFSENILAASFTRRKLCALLIMRSNDMRYGIETFLIISTFLIFSALWNTPVELQVHFEIVKSSKNVLFVCWKLKMLLKI